MTPGPPDTVIVDVSAWLLRSFGHLTTRLAESPATLRPPEGGAADGGVSVTVHDPTYWAKAPEALSEALHVAALEDPNVRFRAPTIPQTERLTLTVEGAAALLGISRAFAYEAVGRGEIPSIRIGRRVLVPKAALRRMVDGDLPPEDASG